MPEKMADNIDNFFAKKDKKKAKKKVYKAATSLTGNSLVEGNDGVEVNAPAPSKKAAKGRIAEYNDDSWADTFQEEKQPDYTGLKIASMDISEKEEIPTPAVEEEEDKEEAQEDEEEEEEEVVVDTGAEPHDASMPNVSGGKYVPPSRTHASSGLSGGGGRRQVAPDLSTMSFPSLDTAVEEAKKQKGDRSMDDFQKVGPGQGARAPANPNRYQPPGARSQNGFQGLDRQGRDGPPQREQRDSRERW